VKITAVDVKVLVTQELKVEATSSSQDNVLVFIHTDEGITGIAEVDTGPWLVKSAIKAPGSHSMAQSMESVLIGRDPFDTTGIWNDLYTFTAMSGRRGAVICALGAIDIALWDIKGKATGLPVYKLLGGEANRTLRPYASLQPHGQSVEEYGKSLVEWVQKVKEIGFEAAKIECTLNGPYRHLGLTGSDEDVTRILYACREAVGADFTLMVDVQYRWQDARSCLRIIEGWKDLDLFFLETPITSDNLDGYSRLAEKAPMRIAAGEWLNTRYEFKELLERGDIDVLQPDIGRVGGFTEALRVCHMAEDSGKIIVPHCWKTALGIAAAYHLALSVNNCPFIEYLPAELCDSALRRDLARGEWEGDDGSLRLPVEPGLGVKIDPDAVRKFTVDI
jgi:L-alanine-DL-glutamate epimerase-like enolase superfamily enzyme